MQTTFHSAAVTGCTDSRDSLTRAMSLSFGSSLIASSVTGGFWGPERDAFPGVVVGGAIDRDRLSAVLGRDESAFRRLETIVHPLVAQGRLADLEAARAAGVKLAVLDIPLLFETGGERGVDAVVVVTTDPDIQAERVLARSGMTRERFDAILSRQIPDAEKRRMADFIVDTGHGLEAARRDVREIVHTVLAPDWKRPLPKIGETPQ